MKGNLKSFAVVGLQWGDEGKGKIVDYLSKNVDAVVRFQGGHNAGHTIVVGENVYKLSILPSGIIRKEVTSIIGNGVVIELKNFVEELENIKKTGIELGKLYVADTACIILPIHIIIDNISENNLGEMYRIGTTKRGIGPAYADKASRRAIRVCDLMDDDYIKLELQKIMQYYQPILDAAIDDYSYMTVDYMFEYIKKYRDIICKYAVNIYNFLRNMYLANKVIMYEGAQGAMLDLDMGTYPYVTASNTVSSQLFIGANLNISAVSRYLGVVKAYSTRVGMGPFPTELSETDEIGLFLQKKGSEIGTVTSRLRRCGWLDLVALKYSVYICNITEIILTKLDVLGGLKQVKLCTAYNVNGIRYDYIPSSIRDRNNIFCEYEILEGWDEDISKISEYDKLPLNAKKYIDFIENYVGVKISLISISPERNGVLIRSDLDI